MTDLKGQLEHLFGDEPAAPYDIEQIVAAGRRARRRRNVAIAAAGTFGAAGLAAAVVVPVLASAGSGQTVQLGTTPPATPTPTATPGKCYLIRGNPSDAKRSLSQLMHSGRVGSHAYVKSVGKPDHANRTVFEVCSQDTTVHKPGGAEPAQPPAGPPYNYTEQPSDIADRLGAHLHDRVTKFGLPITYERRFAQESTRLESGHPSYFDGNVDVHEPHGYGDIGVQVTHAVTQQVPFDGDCTAASHCTETTLPDGSVLRTGQADAGPGLTVLTAEVHRPDGVVVQAQESNYPFGPDAGSQAHGDQPLTLDQLVSVAEDPDFTF